MITIEIGQRFPLTIKRLGINGEGVGYFKKQVVFVQGALPTEEVVAEVTSINNKYAEAKIVRIRKSSPHRITPRCPVYEQCGGCQLQHLDYTEQLSLKRDIVIQAFERHSQIPVEKIEIRPTIGMDNPWHYRNKSQFQVGRKDGQVITGLYAKNSHELINIEQCDIQHQTINHAVSTVKEIIEDLQIPIYNERKRTGNIRTIVARLAFQTNELQIVLVTAKEQLPKELVSKITKRLPNVTSIAQNINHEKTSLIFGEKLIPLHGETFIKEKLGDISFHLSAKAFFQLNPVQTEKLYNEVKKVAQLTGEERVVDAYAGVGTIGLWLAESAREVRGMDVTKEAVEDANENAKLLGFENVQYEVGKAEVILSQWLKKNWKPDVIVVDPPRTGCDEKLLEAILQAEPERVVYVSCNPSTLVKDLNTLVQKYRAEYVQPVDMFSQTSHVECVVGLQRVEI